MKRTAAIALAAILALMAGVIATSVAACGQDKKSGDIQQAFEKHREELFAIPGVNTVMIVDSGGQQRIEVQVYEGEKTPQLEAALPDQIEGYPVVIVERPRPDPQRYDIAGTIKTIAPADISAQEQGMSGSLLVVADPPLKYSRVDKASVAVPSDATIWWPMGEGKKSATFGDLHEGDHVIVTFSGPVAESYPVQATAADIEIVSGL